VLGVSWTGVCSILAIAGANLTGSGECVHRISRIWGLFILWVMGVRIHWHHFQNIPKDKSVLIVSNHQSACDILAYSAYFPLNFVWIAKKELFKIPLFGNAMRKAGYISIDRKNREKSYQTIHEAAKQIKNISVLIFPEGTRTRDGNIRRFKRGASVLAKESRIPLLPITITGSFERWSPDKYAISPGDIDIYIDPLIPIHDKTDDEIEDIFKEIRNRMVNRVKTNNDVENEQAE